MSKNVWLDNEGGYEHHASRLREFAGSLGRAVRGLGARALEASKAYADEMWSDAWYRYDEAVPATDSETALVTEIEDSLTVDTSRGPGELAADEANGIVRLAFVESARVVVGRERIVGLFWGADSLDPDERQRMARVIDQRWAEPLPKE